MGENKEFLISALVEANELLQEVITRHRRTIKMLRIVNRRLRFQQAIAHANDEAFKAECVILDGYESEEGGLPSSDASQT